METPETTVQLVQHAIACCLTVEERTETPDPVRALIRIARTCLEQSAVMAAESPSEVAA